MVGRTGALGYFGDARRAAVGTELIERVTATGSLVIRKLGETRAGELAVHRFLSVPSVTCKEMLRTVAGRTVRSKVKPAGLCCTEPGPGCGQTGRVVTHMRRPTHPRGTALCCRSLREGRTLAQSHSPAACNSCRAKSGGGQILPSLANQYLAQSIAYLFGTSAA